MKYLFILLLALCFNPARAQSNSYKLYGSWVLKKITYKDGSELPDENALKYTYLKYTFAYPDKFRSSTVYFENGTERSFEIKGSDLQLKSAEGSVLNTQRVVSMGGNLALIQAGNGGYDDPGSLLFSFVPELEYQNSLPLKANDIHSVFKGDTTYVESPKIYATYNNGDSFQQYVYQGIADHISMHNRAEHFVASFIVSKTGGADSVELLETVDAEFDKRFIKVFNKAKKDWKPAMLNGKYVSVRMKVDLRYSTSATAIPAYLASQKALSAYNNKDYEVAEYFYDKAIEIEPKDRELFFRRGMCKLLLGNKSGACEDWNKGKALGSNLSIDAVLDKYCK